MAAGAIPEQLKPFLPQVEKALVEAQSMLETGQGGGALTSEGFVSFAELDGETRSEALGALTQQLAEVRKAMGTSEPKKEEVVSLFIPINIGNFGGDFGF